MNIFWLFYDDMIMLIYLCVDFFQVELFYSQVVKTKKKSINNTLTYKHG